MIDVELRSYLITPASEPKLTNPDVLQESIRCIKVSRALGTKRIPKRATKIFSQRTVSLLIQIFKAITNLQCEDMLE